MRFSARALSTVLVCCSISVAAAESAPPNLQHPGNTALTQQGKDKWTITSFPGLARLYTYDRDGREKSNCNGGCASAWPPLLVPDEELGPRLGDWTIVVRDDGRRQWAYKGHPIYIRFHDMQPDASTEKEGFHLLEP
jgi:predicted lipoprotein with Yx(FWY)xxD motif